MLVIEDNADLRDSLISLLEIMGHKVSAAPDGTAGVELARTQQFDAALIDIGLPGISGYQVAQMLREDGRTKDLRLIALTGYGTQAHRGRSRQAGFDHHLTKPVDPDELEQVLGGAKNGDHDRG